VCPRTDSMADLTVVDAVVVTRAVVLHPADAEDARRLPLHLTTMAPAVPSIPMLPVTPV